MNDDLILEFVTDTEASLVDVTRAESGARLLDQATFGTTYDTINSASATTYSQWFSSQAAITPIAISRFETLKPGTA